MRLSTYSLSLVLVKIFIYVFSIMDKHDIPHSISRANACMCTESEFSTSLQLVPPESGDKKYDYISLNIQKKSRIILQSLTENERMHLQDANMPIRYLSASKGNVSSALQNLKCTIQWRHSFGISAIVEAFKNNDTFSKNLQNKLLTQNSLGHVYVRGYDKHGHAIIYMQPFKEQYNIHNIGTESDMIIHLVYNLERAISCSATKGLDKYVIIVNLTGFRMTKIPSLSFLQHISHILENHYPERIKKVYICNIPLIFHSFWKILSTFMNEDTKNRVIFCAGKKGEVCMKEDFELDYLESATFGKNKLIAKFDSGKYLNGSFNQTFDE